MKRTAKSAIDSVKDALMKTHRDDLIHKSDEELRQHSFRSLISHLGMMTCGLCRMITRGLLCSL